MDQTQNLMAAAMADAALQQLQRQALVQPHAPAVAPAAALAAAAASPAAAVPAVAPVSAAAPAAVANDDKSELEEFRDNVDEKARQAAARSSKKYASEPDAYLRDEFQKIGKEAVRLAERNKYKNDRKELKKLRKRRGQPEETDSSGSSSSSSSNDSSDSDSSDSNSSGCSESDEGSKGRSRKRKRGGRKKGEAIDFKRFRRGRARSKGRSKPEKQAKEFFGRHFESNRARWQTTRNEAEGRRLHALRVMMA